MRQNTAIYLCFHFPRKYVSGRHNVNGKIDVENRICNQCCANEVEDEEHFVLRCDKYKLERAEFLTSLYEIFPELSNAPDKEKNDFLIKADDYEIFTLLSSFLDLTDKIRGLL